MQSEAPPPPSVLLVEAFYGGSHKQLLDLLQENLSGCSSWTLPAKKWHWRARTAALYFSQTIPACASYRILFCSSVLNLCELVALRPDLSRLKKVLYFHENQLVYPVRKDQERDFQYGYNQVLSCLVSDVVVFNSSFNMESFLSSISSFMKLIPDHRPQGLESSIREKSRVLHFPLELPDVTSLLPEHKLLRQTHDDQQTQHTHRCEEDSHQAGLGHGSDPSLGLDSGPDDFRSVTSPSPTLDPGVLPIPEVKPLHIVWPHRWEHDKNPELFFNTLFRLKDEGFQFNVSVLGESFTEVPEIFSSARLLLAPHLLSWGFQASKRNYLKVLCDADVVVSTARHEFFGVAMLEAVHCGCVPLCPKALVYPEIFPDQYLYSTPQQLFKRLREFCKKPQICRAHTVKVDLSSFSWSTLKPQFQTLLTEP